ncbi:hypothetical protein KCP75_03945 [Salmonella enterica subsp. enterica]|nr:hypothetical protein KCP75_03945 [Salmonella enterica subsp. enterica]
MPQALLPALLEAGHLHSMILWGRQGRGKPRRFRSDRPLRQPMSSVFPPSLLG